MKFTMKLLILLFGMLMLTNVVCAESPVEQLLKQMVEQLQKNPTDNALREKIIKLAQTITPAPAVPDEATNTRGAGSLPSAMQSRQPIISTLPKSTKRPSPPRRGCRVITPTYARFTGKRRSSLRRRRAVSSSLQSSPSALDASDVRKRVAGLEFAIEKVSKQKNQGEEFIKKLDGARYTY